MSEAEREHELRLQMLAPRLVRQLRRVVGLCNAVIDDAFLLQHSELLREAEELIRKAEGRDE